MNQIEVINARLHNLKNISTIIPKNKFIVITGVSGSGKSSFIFDTLHSEGQRLYLEAIGIYHDVHHHDAFDAIQGLSPTIAVQQRTVSNVNPRSVIGTVTRILNLLAILYAEKGISRLDTGERGARVPGIFMFNSPHGACAECNGRGTVTEANMDRIFPSLDEPISLWHDFAYRFPHKKSEDKEYVSKRMDNFAKYYDCSPNTPFSALPLEAKSTFLNYRPRRSKSKQQLIFYGVHVVVEEKLKKNNLNLPELLVKRICPKCEGYRLNDYAMSFTLEGRHIGELCKMDVPDLQHFLAEFQLGFSDSSFVTGTVKEIQKKLDCLQAVGLSYLDLYRELPTLSGGETQRLHIMSHLSAKVESVIYIFDEPTAGLHEIEKSSVVESFKRLKEQGNTVIVVEHDESVIQHAEYIMDFGPMAGRFGGEIIYQGEYAQFAECTESVTAQSLQHKDRPDKAYTFVFNASSPRLALRQARTHNLKSIDVDIPLQAIVGICGLSGSGKSSLVMDTLIPMLQSSLNRRAEARKGPGDKKSSMDSDHDANHDDIQPEAEMEGEEAIDGFLVVSQKLARRYENSCVATFLGVWDHIRKMYAVQEDAIRYHYDVGAFSFNSSGSCPVCNGNGYIKRWIGNLVFKDECPSCEGRRFKNDVLRIRYQDRHIADILQMPISEALLFFKENQSISRMLKSIDEMGMGYILLGQSLTTLSGGEAQRLKLARELGKRSKGKYLYILDEPTVGLSYYDIEKLLVLISRLVANEHSVLLIEHDPYVLSYCDFLIELGPGGGNQGGELIAVGTPGELKKNEFSVTGRFLD